MSFDPHRDGHIVWHFMHLYAANAVTETKRRHYVDWLNSLKEVFFCEVCRVHLVSNLDQLPVEPYMKSNVSLFYHSWKLHDTVNGQLNKPTEQRLTYPQAFEAYFGRSPPTLQDETSKQAAASSQPRQPHHSESPQQSRDVQLPPARIESGSYRQERDESQRFLTRGGHPQIPQTSVAADVSQKTACQTCGKVHVQNGPKVDYDTFRQGRRRIYISKN